VLKDNPAFGKALVGAWYETVKLMLSDTPEGKAAREAMAKASGTDLEGFNGQLAATRLFADPKDAAAFSSSKDIATTMDRVRAFLFAKSLLGKDAKSADAIGIELADKKVLGDAKNDKLRFNPRFMLLAAEGKL
jgi:NitT/TauT family transport system substrate-binding protein